MRPKQKVTNKNMELKLMALEQRAGLLRLICSEVKKRGLKKVRSMHRDDPDYWVKRDHDRILDLADDILIKELPTKVEGTGDDGSILIRVTKDGN